MKKTKPIKKVKKPRTKSTPGPKPKKLNEELVLDLASIGCTYEEMASILKVDKSTLTRNFQEIIQAGHAEMDISLRRKQLEVALTGDTQMLKWLGRTRLKQSEKYLLEVDGKMDHTIEVVFLESDDKKKDD